MDLTTKMIKKQINYNKYCELMVWNRKNGELFSVNQTLDEIINKIVTSKINRYSTKEKIYQRDYKRKQRKQIDQTQQQKAHSAVANAVKKGLLIKCPCEICGDEQVVAHHKDYNKKLEVRWLCRKHHSQFHNGLLLLRDY